MHELTKKAQGTIEYLVIIAIVVIVALIVVSLLLGLSSPGEQVSTTANKLNTSTSSIAIVQAIAGADGNGVLALKNNTGDAVTVNKILVNEIDQEIGSASFTTADTKTLQLRKMPTCPQGTNQVYSIKISYLTSNGLPNTKILDNLTLTCEATAIASESSNTSTGQSGTTDTTPPVVTLTSPTTGTTTSSPIDFIFTVTDADSAVKDCNLKVNDVYAGSIQNPSEGVSVTINQVLPSGTYPWIVECTDTSGNRSTTTTNGPFTVTIPLSDFIPPQVTLNSPSNGSSQESPVDFKFTVNDPNSTVTDCNLKVNNVYAAGIANPTENTELTFSQVLPQGTYDWNVECTDPRGNKNTSPTNGTFTITITPPPFSFSESFDTMVNWTCLKGNCVVNGGVLEQGPEDWSVIKLNTTLPNDYNIIVKYKTTKNGGVTRYWIVARAGATSYNPSTGFSGNYYLLDGGTNYTDYQAYRIGSQVFSNNSYNLVENTWYYMKMSLKGSTMTAYHSFDGTTWDQIGTYTDSNPFSGDSLFLYNSDSDGIGKAYVDEITIIEN